MTPIIGCMIIVFGIAVFIALWILLDLIQKQEGQIVFLKDRYALLDIKIETLKTFISNLEIKTTGLDTKIVDLEGYIDVVHNRSVEDRETLKTLTKKRGKK